MSKSEYPPEWIAQWLKDTEAMKHMKPVHKQRRGLDTIVSGLLGAIAAIVLGTLMLMWHKSCTCTVRFGSYQTDSRYVTVHGCDNPDYQEVGSRANVDCRKERK